MIKDPIVEEVRKVRKQIESECGNDWGKLMARFQRIQDKWPGKVARKRCKRRSRRSPGGSAGGKRK